MIGIRLIHHRPGIGDYEYAVGGNSHGCYCQQGSREFDQDRLKWRKLGLTIARQGSSARNPDLTSSFLEQKPSPSSIDYHFLNAWSVQRACQSSQIHFQDESWSNLFFLKLVKLAFTFCQAHVSRLRTNDGADHRKMV